MGRRRRTATPSVVLRITKTNLRGGDFAQGCDDLLVVAFDEGAGSFEELLGAASAHENELKAIGNFFLTVFDRDTRHKRQLLLIESFNIAEFRTAGKTSAVQTLTAPAFS